MRQQVTCPGPWSLSRIGGFVHDREVAGAGHADSAVSDEILEWLLAGDPAIRWQTKRDLLDAPDAEFERERSLVATTRLGARAARPPRSDRHVGRRLYGPKWTSTTYTLLLLRRCGLPEATPPRCEVSS